MESVSISAASLLLQTMRAAQIASRLPERTDTTTYNLSFVELAIDQASSGRHPDFRMRGMRAHTSCCEGFLA
jgi:hypothetical protein